MTWALLGGIAGLAVLDSFNPATLVAVALILLASRARPVAETAGFVVGAFGSVLVVGAGVYLGADAAAQAASDGLVWVRRGAFGLAAAVVALAAARSLRPRRRRAVALPGWFTPWTAAGLGVVMTAADLPNAFPYFIAIERLVAADLPTGVAVAVLAGYAALYCLPCLVLLAAGLRGGRTREWLQRLHARFGSEADLAASPLTAGVLLVVAVGLGAVAVTA